MQPSKCCASLNDSSFLANSLPIVKLDEALSAVIQKSSCFEDYNHKELLKLAQIFFLHYVIHASQLRLVKVLFARNHLIANGKLLLK